MATGIWFVAGKQTDSLGMFSSSILETRKLRKIYPLNTGIFSRKGKVFALNGVDIQLFEGEVLGVVGESGSGKSTLARIAAFLEKPTSGQILFEGRDLETLTGEELKRYRRLVQIVFQDPFASLNPRKTAGQALEEPLIVHKIGDNKSRKERVYALLEDLGLPREILDRYPHEFSGGQRQRLCIGRALILEPKVIIADEPVSSLDVSIRAQILNLMKEIQEKFSLTYLFISHDLSVIKFISDRVAVMYMGRIVEVATSDVLFMNPLHPYTQTLLDSVPVPFSMERMEKRTKEKMFFNDVAMHSSACPYFNRCPYREDVCLFIEVPLREFQEGHYVACHKINDLQFA
ncbi:MAG: ATP-binding cassette domain-containing protein [Syntrophales bacterium]|nr:ATP-binding cassette domain-containing protein [Syntrophales bacterium]